MVLAEIRWFVDEAKIKIWKSNIFSTSENQPMRKTDRFFLLKLNSTNSKNLRLNKVLRLSRPFSRRKPPKFQDGRCLIPCSTRSKLVFLISWAFYLGIRTDCPEIRLTLGGSYICSIREN